MISELKTRLRSKQHEDEIALLARVDADGQGIEGLEPRGSDEADRALREYINEGVGAELLDRDRMRQARQTVVIRNVLAALLILTCIAFPFIVMYSASYVTPVKDA